MKKRKTLEEIQKEINFMDYELGRLCKLQYYDWDLKDRMRYGRLLSMKEKRLKEAKV
jgi:hypothetical protein